MALSLYDAQDVMRKESDNIFNINIYIWSPFCRNFPDFCQSHAFKKNFQIFLMTAQGLIWITDLGDSKFHQFFW